MKMVTDPARFAKDFGSDNTEPGSHWIPGILIETAVLIIIYRIVFFKLLGGALQGVMPERGDSSLRFWKRLSAENPKPIKGIFHPDAQREFHYCFILAVHHLIGGGLMGYGVLYNNPTIWAQGAIIDLVDAVHDSALMVIPQWPFEDRNPKLMVLVLPHHLSSIIITVPSIVFGLHMNKDVQMIGACLLLAGGIGLGVLCFCRTMDRTKHSDLIMEFLSWTMNMIFFHYCRYYIFTGCCYNLFRDHWHEWSAPIATAMITAVLCMTFFNVLVTIDINTKYFTGVIPRTINGPEKQKQ